jgi:membrane protein implicated in regulation of membrane protease activity
MSLAEIFGPMAMIWIFYKTAKYGKEYPIAYGTAYLVSAVVALIALLLLIYTYKRLTKKETLLDKDNQIEGENMNLDMIPE